MMAGGACRSVSCYSKGDKLGEGTYGSVYQARDKESGRLVALKRVKEKNLEKEGMPQTSLREVALLRRLRHPHVVSLIEVAVGAKADSIFLVFEYCSFELAQLIAICQLCGRRAYLGEEGVGGRLGGHRRASRRAALPQLRRPWPRPKEELHPLRPRRHDFRRSARERLAPPRASCRA